MVESGGGFCFAEWLKFVCDGVVCDSCMYVGWSWVWILGHLEVDLQYLRPVWSVFNNYVLVGMMLVDLTHAVCVP